MSDYHPSDHDSKQLRHGRSKDHVALEDIAMQEAHGRSEPYIIPERKSTKVSCATTPKTFKDEIDQMANDVYATYDAAVVAMKEECYEETAVKEFKAMAGDLMAHLKKNGKEFTHLKLSPDKSRKEIASYAQIWIKEADKLGGNFHDSDEWGEEILLCVEASLTQVRRIEKVLRTFPEENVAHLKKKLTNILEEMINIANAPWEKLESQLEEAQSVKDNKSQMESKRSQTSTERRAEYKEHLSRVKLDRKGEEEVSQLARAKSQQNAPGVTADKSQGKMSIKDEKKGEDEKLHSRKENKKEQKEEEKKDMQEEAKREQREEEKRQREEERRQQREEEKRQQREEEKRQQREEEKRRTYEYDSEQPTEEKKDRRRERKPLEDEKKYPRESISNAKLPDEADSRMRHHEEFTSNARAISVSYSAINEQKPFMGSDAASKENMLKSEEDTKKIRPQVVRSRSRGTLSRNSQGNIAKNKPLGERKSQGQISESKSKQSQDIKSLDSKGKEAPEDKKSQSQLHESKSKQDNLKSASQIAESRSQQGVRKSQTQIRRTKSRQSQDSRSRTGVQNKPTDPHDTGSATDTGNEGPYNN